MKKPNSENIAPWIAFIAAIIASVIVAVSSLCIHRQETRDEIHHEIMQERKIALFQALQVIDHVYANSELHPSEESHPIPILNDEKWDLQMARESMNRMIIYCEDPNRTVNAFAKAIGLHNPRTSEAPEFSISAINDFRIEVARELDLPTPNFDSPDKIWIYMLPGTDEHQRYMEITENSSDTD